MFLTVQDVSSPFLPPIVGSGSRRACDPLQLAQIPIVIFTILTYIEKMRNPTNTNNGSGSNSRSVHPNNMKRKGAVAASFDKPQHVQVTKKMKQTMEEACRPQIHLFSEEIVHAGPGPSSKKPRLVSERRPTIPNVPQNSNILGQTVLQAGANHSNLVNEIKTRSKVAAFATDFEHIQLL